MKTKRFFALCVLMLTMSIAAMGRATENFDETKQRLTSQLSEVQTLIYAAEGDLVKFAVGSNENIWVELSEVKTMAGNCSAQLEAAVTEQQLEEVEHVVMVLQAHATVIQTEAKQFGLEEIVFADSSVKEICLQQWDVNPRDGQLTRSEASVVTAAALCSAFNENGDITSFDELQYFTGITSLPDLAFQGCLSLKSVVLPDGVTTIGGGAFASCFRLESVTVSTNLDFIKAYPENNPSVETFMYCPTVTIRIRPTATKTTFGDSGVAPFTNRFNQNVAVDVLPGVTAIERGAFSSSSSIWKVTLPGTVQTIGDYAFTGSAVQEVVLAEGLESIGLGAFQGCENLRSIAIPSTVTYIENGAFQGCTSLTEANIPDGVEFIGAQLFKSSGLTKVTIPASVTKIWNEAFAECASLREVTLEQDDPTKIELELKDGYGNFIDAFPTPHSAEEGIDVYVPFWALEAYQAHEYWKDFRLRASGFFAVDNMLYWVQPNTAVPFAVLRYPVDKSLAVGEVSIPAEITIHGHTFPVTTIAGRAFEDCTSLTDVVLTTVVESVGQNAFSGLEDLTITINPYGDQTIVKPDMFYGYEATNSFTVVLGEGITEVGSNAFNACGGMKSLYLPESLQSFGSFAFTGVHQLADLYVKWDTPLQVNGNESDPIQNGNQTIRLHVPIGSFTAYKNNTYWNTYFDIDDDNDQVGDFVYTLIPNTDHELMVYQYASAPSGSEVVAFIPETVEKNGITYRVTRVGGNIFENLSVYQDVENVYLTIPESVNYVDNYAFQGCKNITVIVKWQEPQALGMEPDFGTECENHKLLVPLGTQGEYEVSNWRSFMTIDEYITFADSKVEEICLANWDGVQQTGPKDGVLSRDEASKVTALLQGQGNLFPWTQIKSFDELKYFTNLEIIGKYAFSHCSKLERVTIPRSVTILEVNAFWFCESLKTVTVEWESPITVDTNSINDPFPTKTGITLIVPTGSKAAYQGDAYWGQFFVAEALEGDADGDGEVTIADAQAIVDYLIGRAPANFVSDNADANGDGAVTIADAVFVVNEIVTYE